MKSSILLSLLLITGVILSACQGVITINDEGRIVYASRVITSQKVAASGFTGIVMQTRGTIIVTQGGSESVTVSGSENVLPLVEVSTVDGQLVIRSMPHFWIAGMGAANMLTFNIVVKELRSLVVNGLADVSILSLSTPSLDVTINGAGRAELEDLEAGSLSITLNGLANVAASGQADSAAITVQGMGNVNAAKLETGSAEVTIPGFGHASLWVTDRLSGAISGSGRVSYYGEPSLDLAVMGLGGFTSMGAR